MSGLRQNQWIADLCAGENLPQSYAEAVLPYLESLAAKAGQLRQAKSRPVVIGISGAPGSGKSTLALFLTSYLRCEMQLSVASLSLDDFYLGKAARRELASSEHSLFATRGVPGTHDVQIALKVLHGLIDGNTPATIRLPKFDKATDDCSPQDSWPEINTPVDVVVFDGWCLGARPQDAELLNKPVNALEEKDDADGSWRRRINDYLAEEYRDLFDQLDALVMLRIPSFGKVLEWRGVQEEKLIQSMGKTNVADLQLDKFIMYFERLTLHMLESMPAYADTIIEIDEQHRLTGIFNQD